MNAKDFFLLVSSMRKAQKDYFRTRTTEALKQSKSLEKQVDAEIQRVNDIINGKHSGQMVMDFEDYDNRNKVQHRR